MAVADALRKCEDVNAMLSWVWWRENLWRFDTDDGGKGDGSRVTIFKLETEMIPTAKIDPVFEQASRAILVLVLLHS